MPFFFPADFPTAFGFLSPFFLLFTDFQDIAESA
jgi:hypothetical protein